LLEGCTIKTRAPPNSFNTYYIQDEVTKIKIDKQKVDGGDDEYKMNELRLTKVTPSENGLYKCAVEFNGNLNDLNSKAVFVNLKGTSIVNFTLTLRRGVIFVFSKNCGKLFFANLYWLKQKKCVTISRFCKSL